MKRRADPPAAEPPVTPAEGLTQTGRATEEAVRQAVAANVRDGRTAEGWTLDELAARSGVSKGMLVAIEHGRTNASIQTLSRVAESLRTTLARLVSLPETPNLKIVVSGEGAELWRSPKGSTAVLLIGSQAPAQLEFWEWVIVPGDAYAGEPELPGSLEIVYVHEGRLALTVGDEQAVLGPGDSALFSPDVRRVFANEGDELLRYCQAFTVAPPVGR
jgi:transcriptional regulator with XRE-family HTH domain